MWQKTLLTLLIASPFALAAPSSSKVESYLAKLKQQFELEFEQKERERLQQRQNFLQLERLLSRAEKENKVTDNLLAMAEKLHSEDYPLKEESAWLLLKAKLTQHPSPQKMAELINDFTQKYPETAKRQKLNQYLFSAYYQNQQFNELIHYADTTPATTVDNQCVVFSAKYQLLAEQAQLNPAVEQNSTNLSPELKALTEQFEQFWINDNGGDNGKLPSACNGIEGYWRDLGLKTGDKVKSKAVKLFQQQAKDALSNLTLNSSSPELKTWLSNLSQLLSQASYLPDFVKNAPLDPWNKMAVVESFQPFLKTLPEQTANLDFSIYQQWAEQWQLSEQEQKAWKIAFLQRFFDNQDPVFILWRDEQIKQLKEDNLTERRLRTAIWQQTDLKEWLGILSEDALNKAEWRYWQAKSDPTHQKKLFESLAKERGFYPMLAAHQLHQPYTFTVPSVKSLSEQQKHTFSLQLERVKELRALQRFDSARLVWVELLQGVDFDTKLALADYAVKQEWHDLAVEATIKAKAWDYIQLRLPNAYSQWFDLNLQNKPISKSFAMAIARQESAWNFQARSHANAIGLMQLLDSTAKITAEHSGLVYRGERDLLDPFTNIMLGTAHLAQLNEKYPNNRVLISAAYNAGARRVERWLARANGRLAIDEFIASIPFYETRGYVQNVLAYDVYYQMLYGNKHALFSQEELKLY